jgi:hypothetical protein
LGLAGVDGSECYKNNFKSETGEYDEWTAALSVAGRADAGQPNAVRQLARILELNPSADLRAFAACKLIDVGSEEHVHILAQRLYQDDNLLVRINSALALASVGGSRGENVLKSAVNSSKVDNLTKIICRQAMAHTGATTGIVWPCDTVSAKKNDRLVEAIKKAIASDDYGRIRVFTECIATTNMSIGLVSMWSHIRRY